MPVGVPKVPYAVGEDEENAEWYDLYNCLYLDRYLFLFQDLKEELGNQLMGIMLYLNTEEDNTDDLWFYINSPGGQMGPGIGLYDVMGFIKPDTNTICLGRASSIASFVVMGGTTGKRVAAPNSRMMIHQPAGGNQGQISLLFSEIQELIRLRRTVIDVYSERTGQTRDRIIEDMGRDEYMTAQEARDYGLVDLVGEDCVPNMRKASDYTVDTSSISDDSEGNNDDKKLVK
jgi:ATP-dependent Clp protease protease subunit